MPITTPGDYNALFNIEQTKSAMLALFIRQPYAEEIVRGIKTVEFRTRGTQAIGRRFHIYAESREPPSKLRPPEA